jgi:hypothetical protein
MSWRRRGGLPYMAYGGAGRGMGGMGGMGGGGGADVLGTVEKSGREYEGKTCWVGAEEREAVRGWYAATAQEGKSSGEGWIGR